MGKYSGRPLFKRFKVQDDQIPASMSDHLIILARCKAVEARRDGDNEAADRWHANADMLKAGTR
jgi:hypothetical protein